MNGNAPAITPISRPNNNPATAAATETNIFIRRVSRKERGVKADSVLIVTIFSCQQRVRHSEKIREQLTQVSGRKQHKYGLNCCDMRSEEHTSELQSRFDLVCRLLLEKKKIDIDQAILEHDRAAHCAH